MSRRALKILLSLVLLVAVGFYSAWLFSLGHYWPGVLAAFLSLAASILDGSGVTARIIADQLGHSRVSMTQDVYLGRGETDPRVLAALEAVDPHTAAELESGGISGGFGQEQGHE